MLLGAESAGYIIELPSGRGTSRVKFASRLSRSHRDSVFCIVDILTLNILLICEGSVLAAMLAFASMMPA